MLSNLRQQGLTPTLAVHHLAAEIHGRAGVPKAASAMVHAVLADNLAPSVQTFNLAIKVGERPRVSVADPLGSHLQLPCPHRFSQVAAQAGDLVDAIRVYELLLSMPTAVQPDLMTYELLLMVTCAAGDLDLGNARPSAGPR